MLAQYDEKDGFSFLNGGEIADDVADALNKLQPGMIATSDDFEKLAKKLGTSDQKFINFCTDLKNGNITLKEGQTYLQAYQENVTSLSARLKSFATSAKAFFKNLGGNLLAGTINALGGMLISSVVSLIGVGVSKLYKQISGKAAEEAKQEIQQLGETARSEFDSIQQNLSSTISTVDEVKQHYAELAQGVGDFGKSTQNQGTLTTDDYKDFLDISNQLSDLFPTLTQGYDDNGNAIINLNGDVTTITSSLNSLVEAQKAVASQQIADKMPDIYSDYRQNVSDYADEYNNDLQAMQKAQEAMSYISDPSNYSIDQNGNAFQYLPYFSGIEEVMTKYGLDYDQWMNEWGNGFNTYVSLDDNEKAIFENIYKDFYNQYSKSLTDLEKKIDNENKQFGQYVFQSLYNDSTYQDFSKNDPQKKGIVDSIISNLDYDTVTAKYGKDWGEAYKNLIQKEIINSIAGIDDTKVTDAINKVLNQDLSVSDFNDNIAIIQGYDNEHTEVDFSSWLNPKIESMQAAQDTYNNIINRFKSKDAKQNLQDGSQKIKTFLDSNGISQNADKLTEFNTVTADITDADEAIQEWTSHAQEAGETVSSLPTTISSAWNQMLNSTDSDTQKAAEALQTLADKGELTIKTFSETDGAKNYFDGLNMSAEEAVKYINSLSDKNSQLGQMSKNIQDITGALGTKLSDGIVSVDDFTGFDATIKGLDSWDEFTKLLGDSSSSMAECQEAANKLATEYVNENATLSLLNDSNREYYEAQLSKMGITNATAVVEAALAKNLGEEKVATEEAIKAGLNLNDVKITAENATDLFANATVSEIAELAKEAQQSGVSAQALALLALKKLNNPTLTTDGDIQNLLALCEGLDLATQAIRTYQNIKSSVLDDNGNIKANNSQEAIQKQEALDSSFAAMKNLTKVNIEQKVNTTPSVGGSGSNGGGGGSGSSTKKKTPLEKFQDWLSTLFDWIEIKLERQTDKISKYISKAESQLDDKKYSSSAKNYNNAIDATNVQVGYEETARDKYYAQANKILDKAVASKVISQKTSDVIATRVKNGSMNISEYSDEIQDVISAYQEWYNKGKDASDALEELHKNIRTYIQDLKDVRDKQRDAKIDSITGYNDIATGTVANSTSAKNSQLNASNSALKKQNSTYGTYVKNVISDTNGVAKSGSKSISSALKKVKNTKYKKALQNAQKAIKNKKAVSSSDLSVISKYSTYVYNRLYAYNVALENAETARMEYATAYSSNYADTMKNIAEKYSNKDDATNDAMDLNSSKSDNAVTAKSKNNYIDKQMAGYDRIASDNQAEINEYTKTVKSAKKTIGKSATAKAYSGLKASTKKAVSKVVSNAQKQAKSGKAISASTISKLTEYYKKGYIKGAFYLACIRYNNAVESLDQTNKQKEIDKQTAIAQKAELAQQKFSNISTEMDNKRHKYEQTATELNNKMAILEERGNGTSSVWYQRLKTTEQSTNNELVNKRNALIQSLNEAVSAGNIEEGSEKWAEMQSQIDDVTNSIDASTKALAEYDNQIMQVHWDRIDEYANKLDNLVSETNFVINELSRRDLTSDKTGGLTDEGNAVAGLHVSSYQTYSEQARTYRDEIEAINKQLASDPYNQKLIAHKEELVKSYQDAIAGAQDEKYAVIDLIENGYASLKNHISDLIDQYNDLISSEKNAYDYANNISDKTQQIANLRKQLAAYSGDVSEEARAKVQELNVSLKDAEKDLKDTQFDQYVSATQDMLSDFQDDLDESIQDIIDSLDDQFTKLINSVNQYWSDSNNTVNRLLAQIGYSATRTWNQMSSDGEVSSNTSTAINGIYQFLQTAWEKYDQDAKNTNVTTGITNVTADTVNVSQKDSNDGKSDNKDTGNNNTGSNNTNGGSGSTGNGSTTSTSSGIESVKSLIEMTKKLTSNVTATSTSGKKLSKSKAADIQNFIESNLMRHKKKYSEYGAFNQRLYTLYNGGIMSKDNLNNLAKLVGYDFSNKASSPFWQTLHKSGIKGFRRGSEGIPYDMIANLGEDGTELQYDISKGVLKSVGQNDMIFTAEQAKTLMNFAKNPMMFSNMYTGNAFRMPNMPVTNRTDNDINITIGDVNLEGVQNPQQFASSMKDAIKNNTGGVRNMIKDTTVGSLSSNHNSLGIRKY